MRSFSIGATLALTMLAAACSQRSDSAVSSDEFKKDLAAASVGSSALATSPSKYERLRFVSSIELSRATEKAPRPKRTPHHDQMAVARNDGPESNGVATNEVITVAAETRSPVATTEAVPVAIDPVIEEPIARASGSGGPSATASDQSSGSHNVGQRIGSVLGAIFGNVVIRGGHGDDDKCDPRSARGRGVIVLGMPMGTNSGTSFPHHVYR